MRAARYKKGSSHSFAICNIKIFNGAEVHELPLALMRGTSIVRYSYGDAMRYVYCSRPLHLCAMFYVQRTTAPPTCGGSVHRYYR